MRKPLVRVLFSVLLLSAALAYAQVSTGTPTADQLQRALDESPGPWASEAIELVVSQGLYIGYPDGGFGWRDGITRAEFAVVLARLIRAYGLDRMGDEDLETLRNAVDELRADLGEVPATLAAQGQELAELRRAVAAIESMGMAVEGADVAAETRELSARLAEVERALSDIRASLNAQPAEPGSEPEGEPGDPASLQRLEARLAALEQDRDGLGSEAATLRESQRALEARLAELEARVQGSDGDLGVALPGGESAPEGSFENLRGRVERLEDRLDVVEEDLVAVREEIDTYAARMSRLERSLLPDRAAFYVNVAAFGSSPDGGLTLKATLGHDSVLGAIGARASFEFGLGVPHNVSGALTYRQSFGASDGYFGIGAGASLEATMAMFGEVFVGMNYRFARNLGVYVEGRYRPYFDGTGTQSGGIGGGISLRF